MKLGKFLKDEQGNVGTIIMLVTVAVGILALAIILTIGPGIGYSITSATASTIPATSQWYNASGQGDRAVGLNGSQLWVNTTPMLGSGAMVVVAALIIAVLLGAFLYSRREQ